MAKIEKVDIATLATGALIERANDALGDIIKNILDPNTEINSTRSVSLVIKLKPMESREVVTYDITAKTKFAPARKVTGVLFVGMDGNEALAWEKDPNQVELNLTEANKILNEEKE